MLNKSTYSLRKIFKLQRLFLEAIKIEIKTELINTKQTIFACIKNKKNIPIIQLDQPIKINELEEKAIKIASFLKVPVTGI